MCPLFSARTPRGFASFKLFGHFLRKFCLVSKTGKAEMPAAKIKQGTSRFGITSAGFGNQNADDVRCSLALLPYDRRRKIFRPYGKNRKRNFFPTQLETKRKRKRIFFRFTLAKCLNLKRSRRTGEEPSLLATLTLLDGSRVIRALLRNCLFGTAAT